MTTSVSCVLLMRPLPLPFGTERLVALGLELMRELGATVGDDPPVDEDVHEVRRDVVEDALVVRDDERARLGPTSAFTPFATIRSASMSRPESVSSSTAIFGFSIAICRISTRFFSPPEKPSLRYRDASSRGTLRSSIAASRLRPELGDRDGSSSPPFAALRVALIALRRKLVTVTPGIACGYWKARKSPRWARSSAPSSVTSSPSNRIWPPVTS